MSSASVSSLRSTTPKQSGMTELRCELYGTHVCDLAGDTYLTADVVFAAEALERWGIGSPILSVAAPLAIRLRRSHAARRRAYFSSLLPEGRHLTRLAERVRSNESDFLQILARYGRDVSGALQIFDPREMDSGEPALSAPLDEGTIAALLSDGDRRPLGNDVVSGKTSLAGVQEKLVLVHQDGLWHQALRGAPSTHILKPASSQWPTMIFDEEYGHRISRRLGLARHEVQLLDFGGTPTLVVERFDRDSAIVGGRVHVEDLAAALGAVGRAKYQEHGGIVTHARIAAILRTHTTPSDVRTFARQLIATVAMGNLDMHAKNVSLLHLADGSVGLAPAYDMVPMAHLPSDQKLAMSVAGVYRHDQITSGMLEDEIGSWGIPDADALIDETLETVLDAIGSEVPHSGAHAGLRSDISAFAERLRRGRPCGAPITNASR